MRRPMVLLLLLIVAAPCAPAEANGPAVILVTGAPGTPEFGKTFAQSTSDWQKACERAGIRPVVIGQGDAGEKDRADRERLKQAIAAHGGPSPAPLWIVLIGHGTYDGRHARFNLRGPDVSADELAQWLEPLQRPLIFINTAPASAPFIDRLSGADRIILTATKSGHQLNATRFGQHLAKAVGDTAADLDKDGQTSVLEAFLRAAKATQAWYAQQGRLATEHALIDDNGDGRGSRAEGFTGVRPTNKLEGGSLADGRQAHRHHLIPTDREKQLPPAARQRRAELEQAVESLRRRRDGLDPDDYYRQLEALFVELAELYDKPIHAEPSEP